MENLQQPTLPQPQPLSATPIAVKRFIFTEQTKEYVKRENQLEENIQTIWALVWGQSSDSVRTRFTALGQFETMQVGSNVLLLLDAIWALSYNLQDQWYICYTVHLAKRQLMMLSQGKTTTNQDYLEHFTNIIDDLNHCGASIDHDTGVINKTLNEFAVDPDNPTDAEQTAAEQAASDWYLAFAFLAGSDRTRYGMLLENPENDFLQGQDTYPKNITRAYNLLVNWKQDPRNYVCFGGPVNDGLSIRQMKMI